MLRDTVALIAYEEPEVCYQANLAIQAVFKPIFHPILCNYSLIFHPVAALNLNFIRSHSY